MSSKALPLSCTVFSVLKAEFSLSDAEERSKSATKLGVLICVTLIAMLVEIVGGLKANSLAVLTYAAHLLTCRILDFSLYCHSICIAHL